MTEDEAKAKWCPLARVWDIGMDRAPVSFNRVEYGINRLEVPDSALCLGSGCMAWRWTGKETGFCGIAGSAGA